MQVLGFIACAIVIFFCGRKLSFYGDVISTLTGMGKAWVGLILLASITSLPEMITGISAVTVVGEPDLAVGDILGSCAFNLGILAVMDVFVPHRKAIFGIASRTHVYAALFGIILLVLAGAGLFLPVDFVFTPWIGLTSILFIIVYLVSMQVIYRFQDSSISGETAERNLTLKKAILMFSIFALIAIIAAIFLPYFAEEIAVQTGLGRTFIGTLLLAASTSLPEISVSFAAVRMGSIDLSVGNLLGSNLFNILILAIDDLFYTQGHLLKDASDFHLLSVFSVIIMSAVAVIGLSHHSAKKRYKLAYDALVIFVVYIINILLLYKFAN